MNQVAFEYLGEYLDLLLDVICVVDPAHKITYISPGAERVFGYTPAEMIGHNMFEFVHPDDRENTQQTAAIVNAGGDIIEFENRYRHKDGHTVNLHWSARWSERDQMRIGVARDITLQKRYFAEREELIAKLENMALHDPLTRLPNRALLYDRIATTQARVSRDGNSMGVLYLDLDNFKIINDERGHAQGDLLLQAVAKAMEQAVRATDTVARLGGDEFVVLLDGITAIEQLEEVAKKLQNALNAMAMEPMAASIGGLLISDHQLTIDQMLHLADQAMYQAKRKGGGQLVIGSATQC
ncbi:PAS domain S-box protein [Idiomarina tyrosinivorans]|uniref:PAS domain S-box protein n=1 Tax=Idiomarina tyrosinivorans TaxID=1445662 RepID=A0A432ZUB2_9GAMM|nr:GGDEF domain-containing protein [Idiomarina tyrosinivorans]RUO81534.1 PAS domain S-box protein [Idiomarina tyrosinivorans]